MQGTLTQKIEENFDNVALKKALVKVPRLRIRKSKVSSKKISPRQRPETTTSAIIGMILKAAAERKKENSRFTTIQDHKRRKASS